MKIFDIYLKNFRKFDNFNISFDDKFFIEGLTGSGKTSIIESCYISLSGKSFRTSYLKDAVKNENENFFIKCTVEDGDKYKRVLSTGVDSSGKRKIFIDGILKTRKELVNIVTSVVHTPDDINIIDGFPSKKRDFLDKTAFIEEKGYFDDLLNYTRFIKQKSASLKRSNKKAVTYLNEASVPLIDKIRKTRSKICDEINKEFQHVSQNISPSLFFDISSPVDDKTEEKLYLKLDKELEKGHPLYGPHLDTVTIKTQTGESKNMSMGEKYLISVMLKLSELSLHSKKGVYPLFFMDDAFVFLDREKRNLLFDAVMDLKNQVIMTSSVERDYKSDKLTTFNIV